MSKLTKKKIIIVGYKSFIQSNLSNHLKKKYKIQKIKFNDLNQYNISDADFIINCSNSKSFFYKQYLKNSDRNLKIANLIKKTRTKFIILSTRQVYDPKLNITERSKLKPINMYAKNCLKSENFCKKIIKNKLLILRLSNVIGYEIGNKKKPSLMSIIIKSLKNKKIYFDNNYILKKDFLPIKFLCLCIEKLIQKKIVGIVNIGTGIPVTVKELIKTIVDLKRVKIVIKLKNNFKDNHFCYKLNKFEKLTKIKINKKQLLKYFSNLRREINKI